MSIAEIFYKFVTQQMSPTALLLWFSALIILILFTYILLQQWYSKSNDIIKLLEEIKELLKNSKKE